MDEVCIKLLDRINDAVSDDGPYRATVHFDMYTLDSSSASYQELQALYGLIGQFVARTEYLDRAKALNK